MCIIGGAVYGAYRYRDGDFPFFAAGSDKESSATPSSSDVVLEEGGSSRVAANGQT